MGRDLAQIVFHFQKLPAGQALGDFLYLVAEVNLLPFSYISTRSNKLGGAEGVGQGNMKCCNQGKLFLETHLYLAISLLTGAQAESVASNKISKPTQD